uniref:Uncharacterized protein n=1 Tax=Trichobilharzia regenti TaxID=157069 RepID=A0AA85K5L4_TRIRE|nr:unnamed protein product [Trichobilharzia regenti]
MTNSYSRRWNGIKDAVHPLSRTAHSAVSHGRYIYVLNGYGPHDNKMVLMDQAGLTRFDILTNCVELLPIHWDIKSLQYHMFNESILLTSGGSAVIVNDTEPACIYTFGGYSALGNIHVNALCRIELGGSNLSTGCKKSNNKNVKQFSNDSKEFRSHDCYCCCQASVISGHGILSCLSYLSQDNALHQCLTLTMLKSFQRKLEYYHHHHQQVDKIHKNDHCHQLVPSPRDKLCMEYWHGRLYAFGGYGPNFIPSSTWPNDLFHWPYLHDPNDTSNWIMCDANGGWNSQLLVYDLQKNSWKLIKQSDVTGCFPSPRAAHSSTLLPNHGWMIIFGGRGPTANHRQEQFHHQQSHDFDMGRLNDMYCLDLNIMQWTRILTPLDIPYLGRNSLLTPPPQPHVVSTSIWPCGRSWMDMTVIHESSPALLMDDDSVCNVCYYHNDDGEDGDVGGDDPVNRTATAQLFLLGGWSNLNEALNDAYLIDIHFCRKHKSIEAKIANSTKKTYTSQRSTSSNSTTTTTTNTTNCHDQDISNTSTSFIQSIHDCNSQPAVVDGFKCLNNNNEFSNYSAYHECTKLFVTPEGEVLSNETYYISLIESLYSCSVSSSSSSTTDLLKASSISSSNNNDGPITNEIDYLKLFLHDINYHLFVYQKLSFNVINKAGKLDNNGNNNNETINHPKSVLYRIALMHTMFIQYLVKNYCRYTILSSSSSCSLSSTSSPSSSLAGEEECFPCSRLIEIVNQLCANCYESLHHQGQQQQEQQQTVAFSLIIMIGILLKFMLPWQIFHMLLQEGEEEGDNHSWWLPNQTSKYLIKALITRCGVCEYSPERSPLPWLLTTSSSVSWAAALSYSKRMKVYSLDFNNPILINKFISMLPIYMIIMPTEQLAQIYEQFRQNFMHDRFVYDLSEIIQSTYEKLSFLSEIITRKYSLLSQSFPLSTSFTKCEPIHRHWHRVTLGLNGIVYAIGGTTIEALNTPIECYFFNPPAGSLKIQCFTKITKMLLSSVFYAIQKNLSIEKEEMRSNNSDDEETVMISRRKSSGEMRHHRRRQPLKFYECIKTLTSSHYYPVDLTDDGNCLLKFLEESLSGLLNNDVRKCLLEQWLL